MEIFLEFESTLEEGLKKFELDSDAPSVVPESGEELTKWVGEVTAANCDAVWDSTRKTIESHLINEKTEILQVDLSKLVFIDSSGVGTMVKVKKFAKERGIQIQFLNPGPAVENVLQLTQMKKFLLDH
jgi:anti-anti-sigma factor